MTDFDGRTVLVTGGAKGVGRAIVREFAHRGAKVLINYFHSREAAEETLAALQAVGTEASLVRGSVAKRDQVAAMFAEIRARHGRLDVLVNNAASGALKPSRDLDDRDWARTLDTNLLGALWCAQEAVDLMPPHGGAIVNLSSLGAGMVIDNYLAVGTSKAAVEALTRYLAIEYAPKNIRVNTASCGLVDGTVAGLFPRAAELRDVVVAGTPLGRLATEDELARVVMFLASEDASWVTGQTVVADGGLSLGNVLLSPPKRYERPRLVLAPGNSAPPRPQPPVTQPPGTQPPGTRPPTAESAPIPAPATAAEPVRPVDAGLAIAVVGMGMVVPGGANPKDFFRTLRQDQPVFTEPGERWDLNGFYAPLADKVPDTTYVRTSGYIHRGSDGAPRRGAEDYTTTWLADALRQSLDKVKRLDADRHMLVVGYTADGSQHLEESLVRAGVQHRMVTGEGGGDDRVDPSTLAEHLRHAGDSPWRYLPHVVGAEAAAGILPEDTELLMVDTACSSSLYALDIGMRALRSGSTDVAVCGGSFALGPRGSTLFSGLRGLSKREDVRSFDRDADGVLFSDGAATVVLKTLERAQQDGDRIYGVLGGVGTSSDGRGKAIYAPNPKGQRMAVERAFAASGAVPSDIEWVVAHATGTPAGDEAEIQTLKRTLGDGDRSYVTSNKSLVGHTGWVAGVVSLIHILQAMAHDTIPAQRRFGDAPPEWELDSTPLTIPHTDIHWPPRPDSPRTAAVSGFGFGGTNAHLVVREHHISLRAQQPNPHPDDPVVLVGWTTHLPGAPEDDEVRDWLLGQGTPPALSFGDHPPLPSLRELKIPPATMRTMDRTQLMALQSVLRLRPGLRDALDTHRDTVGVVAAHVGPTRNGTLYALRTHLGALRARLDGDERLSPLHQPFEAFADEVRQLVPAVSEDSSPGIMPNVIAARIANYFDLHGLNMTLDTGSDSTLSAISVAADYLRDGVLDIALVLGINGNSTPEMRAVTEPLCGEQGERELAEGAVLLVLTRASTAARAGLPVLAELSASHFSEGGAVPMTDLVPTGRTYLAGDSALAILKACAVGGSTTIGSRDPITGKGRTVTVRADGPVPSESAHSPVTTTAVPLDVPTTVTPHVVTQQECPGVPQRTGIPALPEQCLLVTNAPQLLADTPLPHDVVVVSTTAQGVRGVLEWRGAEAHLTNAIDRLAWRPQHVRVLAQVGAEREPHGGAFEELLSLSDLAFVAAKAAAPALHEGGSYAVLLLEAIDGTTPRSATGLFTGLVKSLAQEFPEALVYATVTATAEIGLGLAQLAVESRNRRSLPVAVYTGRQRLVPVAVPRPDGGGSGGDLDLDASSVVVAAGGSRGITAEILLALAERARPKIWVLGSNAVDDHPAWAFEGSDEDFAAQRRDFLRRRRSERPDLPLSQLNAEFDRIAAAREARRNLQRLADACGPGRVRYLQCDVTDHASVDAACAAILAEDVRIDLLIHGAGISRTALVEKKSLADFRAVRDPKVRGYVNLRRALAGHPPRLWCNFGSLIGFAGQVGEVDYASANDFLSSCALHSALIDGSEEFTINWTLWDTVGLGAKPVTRAFMKRLGFSAGMATGEGVHHFITELGQHRHDPVVVHLGTAELSMLDQRVPGLVTGTPPTLLADSRPFFLGVPLKREDGAEVFERLLDLRADNYLLGHQVNGRPTMPGTFVLEMAAEAARQLVPDQVVVAFESVVFHRLLRLHPIRRSAPFRVTATLLPPRTSESRVAIRVTSDVHAPTGAVLARDRLHFELEVVLADAVPTAPHWATWPVGVARLVPDPYVIENPALRLSGAFDTLREPSVCEGWGQATFRLPDEALGMPFTRFQVPVLLLDGLARTSVLTRTTDEHLPLVALSSVGRVELYGPGSDVTLGDAGPVRLLSRPEDDAESGGYRCAAVDRDGRVLAAMRDLRGTAVGFVHPGTRRFVPADKVAGRQPVTR
jgi:NAD(P)-dependent dehydrogenase (short-subunit alcohol dehydrogenase family)/3-oxoacyl-(acyl-carrier-protein) synthase